MVRCTAEYLPSYIHNVPLPLRVASIMPAISSGVQDTHSNALVIVPHAHLQQLCRGLLRVFEGVIFIDCSKGQQAFADGCDQVAVDGYGGRFYSLQDHCHISERPVQRLEKDSCLSSRGLGRLRALRDESENIFRVGRNGWARRAC
jgi:hypothetical protein